MSMWWTCRHLVDADGCKKEKKIFNLLQHVMGMRWMGCMDVLWMGVDTDACKEKRKKEKSYCWVSSVQMGVWTWITVKKERKNKRKGKEKLTA